MEVMDAAGSGLEDGSGAPTGSTVSGDTGINVGVAIVGAGGSADRGGSGPMTLSSRLSRSSAAKGFERTPSWIQSPYSGMSWAGVVERFQSSLLAASGPPMLPPLATGASTNRT